MNRVERRSSWVTQLRPHHVGVWAAGVALGILLGVLSGGGRGWAAPVVVIAVLLVGVYYIRALGMAAGLIVLLIVANAVDHFTFPVGPVELRAEQAAVVMAVVVLGVVKLREDRIALLKPSAAEWLLLAWLVCSLVSSLILSPDRRLSAKVLVLTAICTLGFFIPRRLARGPQAAAQLDTVVRWLLVVFATESAYGTLAYLLHVFGPTISIGPNPASGHLEAYGTLWEQNVFGAFAAAGGVAWVYLGRRRFRQAWVGLALCVGGLVDSLTRAAWLAAAIVGTAGIALAGLRRRINIPMVGVGLLGGMLIAVAVIVVDRLGAYTVPAGPGAGPPKRGLASAIFNFTDFIGRLNQSSPVWSDIRGFHVVLGRGTASFEALHKTGGVAEHVASLPLLVLNDTGVVGLALFAGFVVAVVVAAWRWRHDEIVLGLGQMAIVLAIANLATQTTELMVDWLLVGILIAGIDVAAAKAASASIAETDHAA